jgi:hypothetical protein
MSISGVETETKKGSIDVFVIRFFKIGTLYWTGLVIIPIGYHQQR